MKKEKIIFIISLVMMLLATSISVYATSCLYNSSDVSYSPPSGSGLSANVQDSLTEVYGHCTDYTSMDTRVNALESRWVDYNNMLEIKGNSSGTGDVGIKIYDQNNKPRSGFNYNETVDSTVIASYDSTGTWGNFGNLRMFGDNIYIGNDENNASVTINGSEVAKKPVSINIKEKKNTTNSFSYSGVYVVIPSNSFFVFTAVAGYNGSKPNVISISTSSTNNTEMASSTVGYFDASVSFSGKTGNSAETYYIWVRYENTGQNDIMIKGFYIPE